MDAVDRPGSTAPFSRSSMPRSSSERIASARRSISSSSSWVESAYGESIADVEDLVRPRAADARDQPLVAQQRVQPARVGGEDRGRATPRRAGRPRGRGARAPASSASGRSSQTPARRLAPASVSTSSPPSSKRSRNIGVFGPFAPGREVLAAGRRSSGAPSARARRRRSGRGTASPGGARPGSPRPRAPRAAGRTSSASRCAPARPCAIGERFTSGSSRRRQASISGSSGTRQAYVRRARRAASALALEALAADREQLPARGARAGSSPSGTP